MSRHSVPLAARLAAVMVAGLLVVHSRPALAQDSVKTTRNAPQVQYSPGEVVPTPTDSAGVKPGSKPAPDSAANPAAGTTAKPAKATAKASAKAPAKGPKSAAGKPAARARAAGASRANLPHPAERGHTLDALWPVKGPAPLPGAILPHKRVIAFYGNPLSKRMGILGEFPPDEMLRRLDQTVAEWRRLDPSTPVQPALHLIAVVAQASPGRDGKYRLRMTDSLIEMVAGWAASRNAIVFLDVQVGKSTLQEELPRLIPFLKRPNFHLGIDPEFSMKDGTAPGKRIGTFDAADINYASRFLADLASAHQLPPKMLVIHRFTQGGVTNYRNIRLDPRVQIVMHMDGFGAPWLKRDSYLSYVKKEPVQFAGWKQFTKLKNDNPPTPTADILKLYPVPVYIQYQ